MLPCSRRAEKSVPGDHLSYGKLMWAEGGCFNTGRHSGGQNLRGGWGWGQNLLPHLYFINPDETHCMFVSHL